MMGTGTFALPTFLSLYDTPHEVVGLFTQPDRTGRGHHNHPHPMKEAAVARGTPVFQPEKINAPDSLAERRPGGCGGIRADSLGGRHQSTAPGLDQRPRVAAAEVSRSRTDSIRRAEGRAEDWRHDLSDRAAARRRHDSRNDRDADRQ